MLDKRNIGILKWFNFFTDFKLYAPIAIIYFAKVTGSYALGMGIFSITMVSSALFEIPTGIFSDKIGRRLTVIFGAATAVCYAFLYAWGATFQILCIGALFEGLSRSLYSGNNDALLHDTLAESHEEYLYGDYLGKVSALSQAALAISALLGSILANFSFSLIMWVSFISQIICLILSFRLREPRVHGRESGNTYRHLSEAIAQFIHNRKLRLLSLSSVMGFAFGEAGYQFQAAFYATLWPVWAIGIAKTLSNMGAAFSFHVSGKIIKRFGGLKLLIVDNLYNRVVNITATLFPTMFSPLLMTTSSLLYGVTSITKNSLMQKEFTNEQRATMGSLNSFAGSIVFGLLAFLLGAIADILTPTKALLSLQVAQVINLWFYWRLFKLKK